jgi:hypothetical protein
MDPRAKYTADDRRAQYDAAMKVYHSLAQMTFAVDSIAHVRTAAADRLARLRANDPLRKKLQDFSQSADGFRSKIVATKEGGAITGEERIREFMTRVYGDITTYDGRPTDSQVARADALARELQDVVRDFNQFTTQQLPAINASLKKKKLDPIQPLSQQEWDKMHGDEAAGQPGEATMRGREFD